MDSARDQHGNWKVNRFILFASFVFLSISVLAVFPLRLIPVFSTQTDALLHFTSGIALTMFFASIIPRSDHKIAAAVVVLGIIWEPAEWYYFSCMTEVMTLDTACSQDGLITWMMSNDTWKDMSLVANGGALALIIIGRYK